MIAYKQASTLEELNQILQLQQKNLKSVVPSDERDTDGFLTVEHDLSLLKKMNDACPHIIAIDGQQLVGYALCMHPKFADSIEILRPMYDEINKAIAEKDNYMVMGQVCVAKSHRSKGIFRGLYRTMLAKLPEGFDTIITEVDVKNSRSMKAHMAVGFRLLHTYFSLNQEWALIVLGPN